MNSHSHHIKQLLGVEEALAEEILGATQYVNYPANSHLQYSGDLSTKGIFLIKGICKSSYFGSKNEEILFDFTFAPNFQPYGYLGFFREQKSVINFIAVTDIEGLEISASEFLPIIDKNPSLYNFFIQNLLWHHQRMLSKEVSILQKTSTERYLNFIETYKEYEQDIPLKDIAAYLNIQPGSLSRIRKKLNT